MIITSLTDRRASRDRGLCGSWARRWVAGPEVADVALRIGRAGSSTDLMGRALASLRGRIVQMMAPCDRQVCAEKSWPLMMGVSGLIFL